MNLREWILTFLFAFICVFIVLFVSRVSGQQVIPYIRMGLTQAQIDACTEFFKPGGDDVDKITCGDLKQLYEEHCVDQKPETEVSDPWKD